LGGIAPNTEGPKHQNEASRLPWDQDMREARGGIVKVSIPSPLSQVPGKVKRKQETNAKEIWYWEGTPSQISGSLYLTEV